ncbi:hypothetical protein BX600DRAFT_16968 [Xylariales sp. PMI_506]|nr:hypothetical protein BX600DRAFT_16968 [Xylariales sp. PMI_506]
MTGNFGLSQRGIKRSADTSGLYIASPEPKRVHRAAVPQFMNITDDESKVYLQRPTATTSPLPKSPSPDYRPESRQTVNDNSITLPPADFSLASAHFDSSPISSPLSILNSSAVITQTEFNKIQNQRMAEECFIQDAEENLFNTLIRIKTLTGGRLPQSTYGLLSEEVQKARLARLPAVPIWDSANTETQPPPATHASTQTTASATAQATMPAKSYVAIGVQTEPASHGRDVATTQSPETSSTSATYEYHYKKELEWIKKDRPLLPINQSNVIRVRSKTAKAKGPDQTDPPKICGTSSASYAFNPTLWSNVLSPGSNSSDEEEARGSGRFRVSGAACYENGGTEAVGGAYTKNDVLLVHDQNKVDDLEDLEDYQDDTEDTNGFPVCSNADYNMNRSQNQAAAGDQPEFYGVSSDAIPIYVGQQLRFQDREHHAGHYPSAAAGHRLNLSGYLDAVGSTHMRDPEMQIRKILTDTLWGSPAAPSEEWTDERNWCRAGGMDAKVMAGFPLVEDVEFVVPDNRGEPSGDCYWRAIAYHLYGSDQHWDIIKAEHLAFVHYVLATPGHARHELYKDQLNARFFRTASTADLGVTFTANMYQVLHMPHAWTPSLMQQVTADLYNICIITFTLEGEDLVVNTALRGCYNSRHVFLQFAGNHYRPMCPNHYAASEFRYPRVTVEATARFSYAPPRGGAATGERSEEHPWRNDFTEVVPRPVPRLFGCDVERLASLMGSRRRWANEFEV